MSKSQSRSFIRFVSSLPRSERFFVEKERDAYLIYLRDLYAFGSYASIHIGNRSYYLSDEDIFDLKRLFNDFNPNTYEHYLRLFYKASELKDKIKWLFDYLGKDL